MIFYSHSEASTLQLGSAMATCLKWGDTVTLFGDLGAGKTVLSRGVARGLGITEAVTSPTFTVVQEYRLPSNKFFFHLDMYRIDNEEAALAFGIEDFIYAPDAITIIEWPERIPKLLPPEQTITLTLEHTNHDLRAISIPEPIAQKLLATGLPDGISTVQDNQI